MVICLKKSKEKIEQSFHVIILLMNVLSLVLGILYLYIGRSSLFWNIYGFIMLATFMGNIRLAAMEKSNRGLSYLYLLLSSVWMIIIFLFNTIVSIEPTNQKSQSIVSILLLFSLFLLGGIIAADKLRNIHAKTSVIQVISNGGKMIKNISIVFLSAVLYVGVFFSINLLRNHKISFLEVFLSEYALFFSIAFLSIGVLIIKLLDKKKYYLYYTIVLTTTTFIFIVFLFPLVSIPSLIKNTEQKYNEAFGGEVASNDQNDFLRPIPFSLTEYFFGTPSQEYRLQENVLFYQGKQGIDNGIKLYFDVYSPATESRKLPGGNSVLIRIHGGGWTSGNKGAYNFAQMNKYFSAQGYIVFDIQYGLSDKLNWIDIITVEETRARDFSIDDMVRHIGLFTKYLADHKDDYQANLDSVFISGGSAGGQLALASGLGIVSEKYEDIFEPGIIVKGLIPFYPANGLSSVFEIGGREEFMDPIALVDVKSPPCLIFQGTHDGLVDHAIAEGFRDAYFEKGNEKCVMISMPFGGHGSDLYFSGYYNQVFLYYMERFMYQYR